MSDVKLIQKLLHGTDRVFDKFINHAASNKWNNVGGGIFFTPDESVATRFATGNKGSFGTIDPSNMQDELLQNISEYFEKDVDKITSKDIQTYVKEQALAKDRKLYYHDSNGLIKKFEGNVDPESPLLMMREGFEPRIIEADVTGSMFDLTDPKNAIEAIGQPKTRASQQILRIAQDYKTDPSGYRYQMQGNYHLPPQATDLLQALKDKKYTNIKMPDAYESGFSSIYVPDVEANAVIKKITPLGAAFGMPANDMNPLPAIGDAVNAYRSIKDKVYSKMADQLDLSRSKGGKEDIKTALSFVADPLNALPGLGGFFAPFLEDALASQGARSGPK